MPGCLWHPGRLPGQGDCWILKAYGHSARLTSRRIPKGGEGAPGRGNSTHGCSEASKCRPSGEPRVMGGAAVQDRGSRAHRGAWRGQPLPSPGAQYPRPPSAEHREAERPAMGRGWEGPGWLAGPSWPLVPPALVWVCGRLTTGAQMRRTKMQFSHLSVQYLLGTFAKIDNKVALCTRLFFFLVRN